MKFSLLKSYLNEPYPYYYRSQLRLVLLLLIICLLSFCFSYFFEPFDVNAKEHKINSILILIIHAGIPFPISYIYLSIMDKNIKDPSRWTLWKELINLSCILLLIGVTDFLLRDFIYSNPDNWSLNYFWEEIRNTFLVGFLLLIIVLPLNLERLINKHSVGLQKLPNINTKPLGDTTVLIKTSALNETIELKIRDFLFAKVESNYTELFISSPDGINKILIRITLKDLEAQLKEFTKIYRTHRSYLVNLNAIQSITGNAQGYQLVLKKCAITIPVSRSSIDGFKVAYTNK